jgi:hypothetical protein
MRHVIALLSAIVTLTLAAPAAHAQLNSPVPAGFNHLYSVLGVINSGGVGTYIDCTSTSTGVQTITVQAFDETGNLAGSASLAVAAGKTVRFGTQDASGLLEDSNLGATAINAGAARILSYRGVQSRDARR